MRTFLQLFLALLLYVTGSVQARDLPDWLRRDPTTVTASSLPSEARDTLILIRQGGPYPYRRDGVTFQNREGRLPDAPNGFYREYTVSTPGSRDRGARRIISGGRPPNVFYYTDDHYRSFRRIQD